MKKILFLIVSILILSGCHSSTKQIKLNQSITVSFFYVNDCSQCKAFKQEAIPLLENTFGDQITIQQYDLDEESTEKVYDQVIDSLVDFDEEFYGNGPFIVVDGYFALLGYEVGDEEYLIKDIESATLNKELSYEMEGRRFLFTKKRQTDSSQSQYYLYLYYAKSCPICKSFIDTVIPQLEKEYDSQMKIICYDIDDEKSIEAYAKTCSLLQDYYVDDNSGSVPFIVLDGYFAKVGYEIGDQEEMIQLIHDMIEGKKISSDIEDIYYFQEGKTFH